MNQYFLKEKTTRELFIAVGFCLEGCLFILTGFFLAYRSWFLFGWFLFLSLTAAFKVGDWIAENALLNYKWGLD